MLTEQIALVTGANRGIGLEVVRQMAARGWTVLLGSRDAAKGEQAAVALASGRVTTLPLDVADGGSVTRAAQAVAERFGRLDVLVNNAAILLDDHARPSSIDLALVETMLNTNTLGPWRMTQAFLPLLRKSAHPRIVNVSSEAGSLADMDAWGPGYSTSKAALNAVTRGFAAELPRPFVVNAICPGWVATDMGGGGRPIPEGAASVLWAVDLPDDGPSGGFFQDGRPLRW